MTTSFAQRGEDTKLWSFFDKSDGHYIDIGANDPVIDSVSKSFYDAGWRGINVEPLNIYASALEKAQPESQTLCMAVGDFNGGTFLHYEYGRSGLSTCHEGNAAKARLHNTQWVNVITLAELCDMWVNWPIDWLKIDVEGWEKEVISGGDWDRYRPTIVCVEATIPQTDIPNHEEWEPLLLAANYELIDWDGLNRWYRCLD